ncbi:class I SAM-dependent methyltransferase [Limnohabitans sp. Rim8]|jgi:SAM-dependent methyltransferase|uniref:class I SAM-dependent methyltransferase n=1 Tax=Limnohabitans sp. Rim8 TaxID=1100718 RepID=UPI0033063C69
MTKTLHGTQAPSAWLQKWAHLITPQGSVLDVACGAGRHMQFLAERGHGVTGVDRSPEAIEAAKPWGHAVLADIENGPWPFEDLSFDAVIVTHYLWRALMPTLVASLAPGGVLVWETFAAGNETVGKPSRPDFLLKAGELLQVCAGLRVVAFEDGFLEAPERFVQRIVAVRESTDLQVKRYPL